MIKGKGKLHWKWVVAVCFVFVVVLGIILLPLWAWWWGVGTQWPGSFVYMERRWFDTPDEAAALMMAETFEYSLIPVGGVSNFSDASFYQGVLEYSVVPISEASFLSNATLFRYMTINHTFNPYVTPGRRVISYVANCTYFLAMNMTLNATALESGGNHMPVVFASHDGLIVQRWGPYGFDSSSSSSFWRGGYWEMSGYAGFEYERLGSYVGPLYLQLNFTDVYFVDMQLSIIRRGRGSYGWYDEFWFYQRVVVDSLGQPLFVSYHDFYIVTIM
ncbi:MAG: hypothetical protein ACFFCF_08195 [Promethearchaeota archaeon]